MSLIATTMLQIHSHLPNRQGLPPDPKVLAFRSLDRFQNNQHAACADHTEYMFPHFPSHACHYAREFITQDYRLVLRAILVSFVSTCLHSGLRSNGFSPDQQTSLLADPAPFGHACLVSSSGTSLSHASFLPVSWRYSHLGR